jgi:hypothetical protein
LKRSCGGKSRGRNNARERISAQLADGIAVYPEGVRSVLLELPVETIGRAWHFAAQVVAAGGNLGYNTRPPKHYGEKHGERET